MKNHRLEIRLTKAEYHAIRKRAALYAQGNISAFMIMAGIAYIPAPNQIKEKKRRPKRGASSEL